jgi:Ca-activated chloride channel family protein
MTHFDPQDPRLTAFALGELTGVERAEFETHVASCAECAKLIDESKQLGELVTAGLRYDGAVPEKLAQLPLQVASKEPARRWNRRRVFAYATAASLAGVIVGGVWISQLKTSRYLDMTAQVSSFTKNEKLLNTRLRGASSPDKSPVKNTDGVVLNLEYPQDMRNTENLVGDEVLRRQSAKTGEGAKSAMAEKNLPKESTKSAVDLAPVQPPPPAIRPTAQASPNRTQSESSAPTIAPMLRAIAKPSNGNPPPAAENKPIGPQPAGSPTFSKLPSPYYLDDDIHYSPTDLNFRLKEGREFGGVQVVRDAPRSNTESYARIHDNPFLDSKTNPLSTFSIDVDTGSYSNVRRFLTGNQLPPPDAVRIEELLNYFNYDYAPPTGEHPFAAHVEVASAPWMPAHRLVRVGIKGKVFTREQRPAANLVFLIDVSGSMSSDNKLPLVKKALKLIVDQLDEKDRVSMVVYAGASGLVLDTTPAYQKEAILTAIDRLQSGGSTNGGAGIQLAYAKASEAFIKEGVNRVILATDGDFNVGVTNQGELTRLIEKEAKSGVFLSVLGFGMGNLKDATLEQLADKGNGTYGYIDTLAEARKVFVEQVNGTLVTIAKDVKIQIEFNPAQVASYRLIGYENRMLRKEDFNDDTKDAGEIGAGHTVTALYEVVPVGVNTRPGNSATQAVDPLKYQTPAASPMSAVKPTDVVNTLDELLTLKLRYKQPDGDKSTLIETPVKDSKTSFEQASSDLRFAASVAAFGMRLRGSEHAGDISWPQIIEFARRATGEDANGYRHEFVTLVEQAAKLSKK